MGAFSSCLGSRVHSDESDGLDQHPSERTRLLPSDVFRENLDRVPQNQAELEQLRTQEVLKGIVQRTADNLIDISSIRMLDRIQPEHAVERAAEYRSILAGVGPQLRQFIPSDTTNTLSNSPPDPNSRFSDLLAGGDISKEDPECEEMAEVIQRVQATLKEIKIDPVGDIVVPFMST